VQKDAPIKPEELTWAVDNGKALSRKRSACPDAKDGGAERLEAPEAARAQHLQPVGVPAKLIPSSVAFNEEDSNDHCLCEGGLERRIQSLVKQQEESPVAKTFVKVCLLFFSSIKWELKTCFLSSTPLLLTSSKMANLAALSQKLLLLGWNCERQASREGTLIEVPF
jgi:hypothetical protein